MSKDMKPINQPKKGNAMTIPANTVIHADCLTALPELPAESVNFILTDPPYITRYKSRDGRTVPNDDNAAWLKPAFAEMYRVLAPDSFRRDLLRMAAGRPLHAGLPRRRIPGRRAFRLSEALHVQHASFSAISTNARICLPRAIRRQPADTIGDVIDWTYSGNKLHPTQKPLSVLLPLVETFSAPQAPCSTRSAGSGSSLLAARCSGRNYIGMELDAKYHAIASRRLA